MKQTTETFQWPNCHSKKKKPVFCTWKFENFFRGR